MLFSELQSPNHFFSVAARNASLAVLLAPYADRRFCSAVRSRLISRFAVMLRPRGARKLTILNWKGDEVPGFGSFGAYGQFEVGKWLQLRNSGWRGPPPCQGSVESPGVPCQTKMVGSTLQHCCMELYYYTMP